MKKVVFALIAVCVLLFGCQGNNDANVIKIACNLPMTGDCAIYGESVKNGYEMALKDLQDSLLLYGFSIKVEYQDNQCVNRNAISIAQNQLLNGFDIYVSGITQQTFAVEGTIEQTGVPHFIWSFYPLILPNNNMFRTWVNLPSEPDLFKQLLLSDPEAKKVACVYLNAASGIDLFNKLFIPMIDKQYEIVYNEPFEIDRTDFKSIAIKIKESCPDYIFVNGFQNHIIQLAKEFNTLKIKKSSNIVFTFDLMDAMSDVESSVLEGYIANIPDYVIQSSDYKTDWTRKYIDLYNREPNYTDAYAYDCMNIIFEAIKEYRENDKQNDLNHYIQNVNIKGLTGPLSFSENGNLNSKSTICVVKSGSLVPLELD